MYRRYFEGYFAGIKDTRFRSYVKHQLVDVLILVMCGVLSGLDELQDIPFLLHKVRLILPLALRPGSFWSAITLFCLLC